jgi:hypothetical protein
MGNQHPESDGADFAVRDPLRNKWPVVANLLHNIRNTIRLPHFCLNGVFNYLNNYLSRTFLSTILC